MTGKQIPPKPTECGNPDGNFVLHALLQVFLYVALKAARSNSPGDLPVEA